MSPPRPEGDTFLETDEGLVVRMPSEVDEYQAPALTNAIAEQIGNGHPQVVIDLRETIGRQALSGLIMTARREALAKQKKVTFRIRPNSEMSRYFKEMFFSDHYPVEEVTDSPGNSQP